MVFTAITSEMWSYNTIKWSESTSKVKELAILETVEIKETDTCKTQIEKDYSDSIWMILNLNVNQKNIDD